MLASMDDEDLYGPELHRLGFGEAVEQGLLTRLQGPGPGRRREARRRDSSRRQLADENNELNLDDAAKIVGCWNGLAKRGLDPGRLARRPAPMRRAVAFAREHQDLQAGRRHVRGGRRPARGRRRTTTTSR